MKLMEHPKVGDTITQWTLASLARKSLIFKADLGRRVDPRNEKLVARLIIEELLWRYSNGVHMPASLSASSECYGTWLPPCGYQADEGFWDIEKRDLTVKMFKNAMHFITAKLRKATSAAFGCWTFKVRSQGEHVHANAEEIVAIGKNRMPPSEDYARDSIFNQPWGQAYQGKWAGNDQHAPYWVSFNLDGLAHLRNQLLLMGED